jgi:hypothetical protein
MAMIPAIEQLVTPLRGMTVCWCPTSSAMKTFGSRAADASHHDVVAIVPEDPGETTLPVGRGTMRLRDPESGRALAQTRREEPAGGEAVAARHRRLSMRATGAHRLCVRPLRSADYGTAAQPVCTQEAGMSQHAALPPRSYLRSRLSQPRKGARRRPFARPRLAPGTPPAVEVHRSAHGRLGR